MKQAASLYALAGILPRLTRVRRRTWFLLAGGALLTLVLVAWAAIALLSWLWGQSSTIVESGRQAAGSAIERVGEVAPGLQETLAPWVGGRETPADAPVPTRDVSGRDPSDLVRYAGLARTYYANQDGRVEVRYAGAGDMHAALRHYVEQLENAGYRHDILFATPTAERHRFDRAGAVRELELRRTGAAEGFEVVIVDQTR